MFGPTKVKIKTLWKSEHTYKIYVTLFFNHILEKDSRKWLTSIKKSIGGVYLYIKKESKY